MRDKDVIKMVSLIQEICIERYDQQKYMEIVQEIYSAFQIPTIKYKGKGYWERIKEEAIIEEEAINK